LKIKVDPVTTFKKSSFGPRSIILPTGCVEEFLEFHILLADLQDNGEALPTSQSQVATNFKSEDYGIVNAIAQIMPHELNIHGRDGNHFEAHKGMIAYLSTLDVSVQSKNMAIFALCTDYPSLKMYKNTQKRDFSTQDSIIPELGTLIVSLPVRNQNEIHAVECHDAQQIHPMSLEDESQPHDDDK
jgi:hypothetical protein